MCLCELQHTLRLQATYGYIIAVCRHKVYVHAGVVPDHGLLNKAVAAICAHYQLEALLLGPPMAVSVCQAALAEVHLGDLGAEVVADPATSGTGWPVGA